MNKDQVLNSQTIQWFPFLLPAVLGLIAGLDIVQSIRLLIVYALCGLPGVFLVGRLIDRGAFRELGSTVSLGAPLGLAVAIGVQQLLVALNLGTFGWLLPAAVLIPVAVRKQFFKGSKFGSRRQFIACLTSSLLFLSDVHWAFLAGAICALTSLVLPRRMGLTTIIIGSIASSLALPKFWYLISNDRLFEEAYSRSIFHFGFWDWYGSSSTWVPYHWLAHAIGGLAQATVTSEIFVGVGVVPIVLAAAIFSGAAYEIASFVLRNSSRAIWALVSFPLFGVFALGESNSADLSVAFGIWALAVVLLIATSSRSTVGVFSLVCATSAIVLLTKVSTGIVIVGAVVAFFIYRAVSLGSLKRAASLAAGCVLSTLVVLTTNFDLFGFANTDDSRSRVVVKFGGFLGLEGAGFLQRTLIVVATAAGGVFLPLVLLYLARQRERRLEEPVILAGLLLLGGWTLRLMLVSYNNESYLEAALLCSVPILVAAVFQYIDIHVPKFFVGASLCLGLIVGIFQQWMLSNDGPSRRDAAIRVIGNSPILFVLILLIVIAYYVTFRLNRSGRIGHSIVILLIAVGLIGSMTGSDTWRIITQVRSGGVWDETNFGASDSFFFGTGDEVAAGKWLRTHAEQSDIIGTNNVCKPQVDCPSGGQTPIAAWSGLRSYIEAERFITGRRVDEVLTNEPAPRGFPSWLLERQSLLAEFASFQNGGAKARLQDDDVRWFWLDLRVEGSRLSSGENVRFRSGPIVLIEL